MLSRIAGVVVPVFGRLNITTDTGSAPPAGSIIIANHTSLTDPAIVLAALRRLGTEPAVLAAAGLWRLPLLGQLLTREGHFPVRRHDPRAAQALRDARAALAAGRSVLLYSEGGLPQREGVRSWIVVMPAGSWRPGCGMSRVPRRWCWGCPAEGFRSPRRSPGRWARRWMSAWCGSCVPFQPELGMGAIGEGGVRVINDEVVCTARVTPEELARVEARERKVLESRARHYRGGRKPVGLEGRTVLVVDDGVATGSTARAACQIARARGAVRIVLAVPVAPHGWTARLGDADELVCLHTPWNFYAIGQFYATSPRPTTMRSSPVWKRRSPAR